MTDEQIIKAYERCFTLGFDESTCYECPFYTATAKCTEDLRDSTLDLINRQKAEIEDLKSQMEWLTGYNGNLLDANTALSGEIEICKSEAIKEFAERLKKYLCLDLREEISVVTIADIDNLAKEMTEVEE